MTLKTRFSFIFAAALLALGGMPVALAQTDSQPVSATLVVDVCAVDIGVFTGELGTWEYEVSQDAYVLTSLTSMLTLTGSYIASPPVGGCDWEISFDGLKGPGGTIDTTYFSMFDAAGVEVAATGFTVQGVTGSGYHFDLVLDSVPKIGAGEYTGQVDVTVTNAT